MKQLGKERLRRGTALLLAGVLFCTSLALPGPAVTVSAAALTVQPKDANVEYGESAVFWVEAEGDCAFQWQAEKNGMTEPLAGETGPVLVLDQPAAADSGSRYSCIITPEAGEAETSGWATLTVEQATTGLQLAATAGETTGTLKLKALLPLDATGTVTFYQGEEELGTVPVSEGNAAWTVPEAPAADIAFTARYSGDGNFTAASDEYAYLAGAGFAAPAEGAVPAEMTYGERVSLPFDAGQLSVSDPTVLTLEGSTLTAAHPGSARLLVTSGTEGENQSVSVFEITVGKRAASVTGISAESKDYDGTTAAELTGTPALSGALPGDALTLLTGTAAFADASAGQGKEVSLPVWLAGEAAACYTLSAPALSADIRKKELTASFQLSAYRGQEEALDLESLVSYTGFAGGETAMALGETDVVIDRENGESVDASASQETVRYPVSVEAETENYTIQMAADSYYEEITYLGQENTDYILTYDAWELGNLVFLRSDVTVTLPEGSPYTMVSRTEDFSGGGDSCTFSRKELREMDTLTFYLKKGEYDPDSESVPNDTGAVARVSIPKPKSDFDAPEIKDLTYSLNGGTGEKIDGKTDAGDLEDISRFYRETVTVSFTVEDADSGLESLRYTLIGADGTETAQSISVTSGTNRWSGSFSVAPGFRGYLKLEASDRTGHTETLYYDYLSVDAQNPTAPTVSAVSGGSDYQPVKDDGTEHWVSEDVTVTVQGSEALSGVAAYEYTVTNGETPGEEAVWNRMKPVAEEQADGASPAQVLKAELTVGEDTDQTYWFRAVSNVKTPDGGAVVSVPSSMRILRQSKAPEAPELRVTPSQPEETGWYREQAPALGFAGLENDGSYFAPRTIYYKLWNTYDESTHTYPNQSGDGIEAVAYTGNNPPVITGDGIWKLEAWTEDAAGNRSQRTLEESFSLDIQAPVITVAYDNMEAETDGEGHSFFDQPRTATITIREVNFSEQDVTVSLTGSDETPRVSGFVTDSNDPAIHTATVTFSGDGDYTLAVSCKDLAGNQTDFPEEAFTIDTQAPEQVTISYEDNWFWEILNTITFHKFFRETVTVTVSAYDGTSGVREIQYWSNGIGGDGEEAQLTGILIPEETDEAGCYEATFRVEPEYKGSFSALAIDRAGNRSSEVESESIYIDDTVPNAPVIQTGGYQAGSWTNQDVTLVVTGSAAFSGIHRYEYTMADGELDGSETWQPLTDGLVTQPDSAEAAASVTRASLTLSGDLNKTVYIRAVSNAQVLGEPAACRVKIQKTLPDNAAVSAREPNAEGWYNADPGITITRPEPTPTPQPESAPVQVYYQLWNTAAGETQSDAEVVRFTGRQPSITDDGIYQLLVWTEDEAGNECPASERIRREYRVDYTDPVIALRYDNNSVRNGHYYDAARTATITVEELNFNPSRIQVELTAQRDGEAAAVPAVSEWSSSGITHRATVRFAADGDYTIRITGSDRAGNEAAPVSQQQFTIDTQAPELQITGVEDLSANRDPVTPVVTYQDINLDENQVSLSLVGSETGQQETGERTSQSGHQRTARLSRVDTDDNYRLSARVADLAGNVSEQSVSFSVNQNGSTFEFLQPEVRDSYTNQPFQPAVRVWNVDEVSIVSVALNGQNVAYTFLDGVIQLEQPVEQDGKYVLTVEVRDAAGNFSSMNPVEFFLDTAAPEIRASGAEEGAYYFDPVTVTLSLSQTADAFREIRINGTPVPEEQLAAENGSVSLQLDAYQDYVIEATAVDAAGNEGRMEPLSFHLSNNLFLRLYQNQPLFWGLVAGLVLLLGGAVTLILVRKRRR